MSTFEIKNLSGIVRNLDKTTLSTLSKPKDIRIGLTVMDSDGTNKIKNVHKLLIYCNKAFFKIFRKYGYIQPMALISIKNGSYKKAKDNAIEYILTDKSQFIFIPDPIRIIGLNQSGFSFKNKTDKLLNDNDILRNQLINKYLDFEDTVDYHQYYTNKNNRNQNLWRKYSYFAINVETNPSFDCKQYITNYKLERKRLKEEQNMVYSFDHITKEMKCTKLNDDKYCKIYQIESFSLNIPLRISLDTKRFNILEQYKTWLKKWYFETSLIDINDKYNKVIIGLYKIPSLQNNASNQEIQEHEFKSLLSNIDKLDDIELNNHIPIHIKKLIKSYKPLPINKNAKNMTSVANKDKDESSDSHNEDHKMEIDDNINHINNDDDEESICLTETQPQTMMIDSEVGDIDMNTQSFMEIDQENMEDTFPSDDTGDTILDINDMNESEYDEYQSRDSNKLNEFISSLLYKVYDPEIDNYQSFHPVDFPL